MNQHLADLVRSVWVFAHVRVVVLDQELAVAVLDNRLGVLLDFGHHEEDFPNLVVEGCLGAEEDVAVGVGGIVSLLHECSVAADFAVVAPDELQEAHDAALVHAPEGEGRCGLHKFLLQVLVEADHRFREIARLRLLDLPDVEIDEAHREHVVSEEGELVFAVRIVRLEGIPQELDVFLLLRGLEGERQVVGEIGGFFHALSLEAESEDSAIFFCVGENDR